MAHQSESLSTMNINESFAAVLRLGKLRGDLGASFKMYACASSTHAQCKTGEDVGPQGRLQSIISEKEKILYCQSSGGGHVMVT